MLTDPLYLVFVLLLLVFISEWLGQKKYFHYLGSSLLVIILAAISANLKLIPSSQNAPPLYEGIFTYVAPLAIFYLLLDVKLGTIREAGVPMLMMFLAGSLATLIGVFAGYHLLIANQKMIPDSFAVAGMYTGTYIGGSANLNAVALQYGVFKNGTLFAAINAADNIITAVWMVVSIALPALLSRWFPAKRKTRIATSAATLNTDTEKETVTLPGFSLLLALGIGTLLLSNLISTYLPQIPSILTLTTVALVLAQVKPLHRVHGGNLIGYLFVLLFLAVVGAYCDLSALLQNKETALLLLGWVTIIVFTHGFFIFLLGGIFKQDWYMVSIASNANIGGATTAAALATSLNRSDLRLPGILAGSLGVALGTYAGILMAEILR